MSDDDYDNLDPHEVDEEIAKKYTELLDMNSAVIQASRQMARDVLRIKDVYLMLAEKCVEIAELHAVGARQTADLTGDLLSNEWGLVELLGDDDDDVDLFGEDDDE